jgi:hypothetical protein
MRRESQGGMDTLSPLAATNSRKHLNASMISEAATNPLSLPEWRCDRCQAGNDRSQTHCHKCQVCMGRVRTHAALSPSAELICVGCWAMLHCAARVPACAMSRPAVTRPRSVPLSLPRTHTLAPSSSRRPPPLPPSHTHSLTPLAPLAPRPSRSPPPFPRPSPCPRISAQMLHVSACAACR